MSAVDGQPLGGQTVVVVKRAEDSDGDWTETARIPVAGCSVQPQPPSENRDGRQQTAQSFRIFGPPELAAARGADEIEVPGWVVGSGAAVVRLDMDGPAAMWPDEIGRPHHVEAAATLTSG